MLATTSGVRVSTKAKAIDLQENTPKLQMIFKEPSRSLCINGWIAVFTTVMAVPLPFITWRNRLPTALCGKFRRRRIWSRDFCPSFYQGKKPALLSLMLCSTTNFKNAKRRDRQKRKESRLTDFELQNSSFFIIAYQSLISKSAWSISQWH